MVDLADRRVLREQHPVAAAEVGDVAHEQQRARRLVVLEQRERRAAACETSSRSISSETGRWARIATSTASCVEARCRPGAASRRVRVDAEAVHRGSPRSGSRTAPVGRRRSGSRRRRRAARSRSRPRPGGTGSCPSAIIAAKRSKVVEVERSSSPVARPRVDGRLPGDQRDHRPACRTGMHCTRTRSLAPSSGESPSTTSPVRQARATSGRSTSSTTVPTRSFG